MCLDSYLKIIIFVGVLLIISFFLVQYMTKIHDESLKSKKYFVFLMLGIFFGFIVDILMLKYPLYKFPKLAAIVNDKAYIFLFFSLPALCAIICVIGFHYFNNKINDV